MKADHPRHDWLQQYADGTASVEVTTQLEIALREDAELRSLLLDYLNVDAALHEVLAYQAPTPAARSVVPVRRYWIPWAAAAVAAILAVVGFQWSQQPWATVVRSAGTAMAVSATVRSEAFQLDKGAVELVTARGAKVVIEAPAAFQFESSQRLRLQRGKLAADVPPSAKGFTVLMPDGKAVDLGTRFGVDVPVNGASEVHVFQGEVIAQAKGAKARQSLRGGEALSLSGKGTARDLRSSAFIQPDEMPSLTAGLAAGQWTRAEVALRKLRQDPALISLLDFESAELPKGTFRLARGRWPSSQAPEFVSTGDHMKIDAGGEQAWPQLTLMTWVRLDRLGEPFQSLYHTDGWGLHQERPDQPPKPGQVHWMVVANASMRLAIYGNEMPKSSKMNWADSLHPVLAERGRWAYLAAVYDAPKRTVRFYLNGAFDSEVFMNVAHPALLGPAQIGNWNIKDRKLSGRIDELVILGRALSDAEINELYDAGNPYH